jgi:hypothetical protein
MKKVILSFVFGAAVVSSAFGGNEVVTTSKDYKAPVAIPCFRDQELQLEIFGSYMNFPHSDDQLSHHRDPGHDGGGGGVGINYFFLRYMGIGADGDVNSNRGGVVDYTGKLIFRFPIETGKCCFAPYIFGGGGGQSLFEDDYNYNHRRDHRTQGAYMGGGGIEWRVTPHLGVFSEGRYTWTTGHNNDGDNAQARLGLRFAF